MNIIISNNRDKPIYEQIVSQVKNMIMNEELQRDGFIETEIGRGTYILARNKDFYKEQKQKEIEEHLQSAIAIAKENAIPLEKIVEVLKILYLEE